MSPFNTFEIMACRLKNSLGNKICAYAVAGVSRMYLANWYPPVVGAASVANAIAYTIDTDGYISSMKLPPDEEFYELTGAGDTMAWGDTLLAGANGGMYRQHQINAVLNQIDIDVLNEGDALSLGRFVAVVINSAGQPIVLGRTGGIKAPAGGFDYTSGAAPGDANGWTILQQGNSTELAKMLKSVALITPIQPVPEIVA